MKMTMLLAATAILISGSVLALEATDEAMELAQNGVQSTTATGEPQTTFIDSNGNLKMVPVDSVPKPVKKPAPITPVPEQKKTKQPAVMNGDGTMPQPVSPPEGEQ